MMMMMMHFALRSIMFHNYSKFRNNDDPTGIVESMLESSMTMRSDS